MVVVLGALVGAFLVAMAIAWGITTSPEYVLSPEYIPSPEYVFAAAILAVILTPFVMLAGLLVYGIPFLILVVPASLIWGGTVRRLLGWTERSDSLRRTRTFAIADRWLGTGRAAIALPLVAIQTALALRLFADMAGSFLPFFD